MHNANQVYIQVIIYVINFTCALHVGLMKQSLLNDLLSQVLETMFPNT